MLLLLVIDAATTVEKPGHLLLEGEGKLTGGVVGGPGHTLRLVAFLLWKTMG